MACATTTQLMEVSLKRMGIGFCVKTVEPAFDACNHWCLNLALMLKTTKPEIITKQTFQLQATGFKCQTIEGLMQK